MQQGSSSSRLFLVSFFFFSSFAASSSAFFEITVVHTNDLHSRFDQIISRGSECTEADARAKKCYGGVARIKKAVEDVRREQDQDALFLNAGDFFQGTVWYSMFKWAVVANLTSYMGYTATSLGNHEFDDGVGDLADYLDATRSSYPSLACNLDLKGEPRLEDSVGCSVIKVVRGHKVGIMGYVTPETKELSSTGSVVFLDEVESLKREAKKLKQERGVEILIAVGHSGYEKDMEIARKVPGLDVVIGGHTNTLLWNGPNPLGEETRGPYPTDVVGPAGAKCLVVHTSGYGKYLGRLTVSFDAAGNVANYSRSNPILLDQGRPQDRQLSRLVSGYKREVEKKMNIVVGRSDVLLDGGRPKCRLEECDFGDFVTDAMASEMHVGIAILNSGGITGSFQKGPITMRNIFDVMPWSNTVDVVRIPGKALREILEHSVSTYDASHPDPGGRFLQISGLSVTYDTAKPVGDRVRMTAVEATGGDEIADGDLYDVAVSSFLANGGDGYKMIPANTVEHMITGFLDNDLIVSYVSKTSPLTSPKGGRIHFATAASSTASNVASVTAVALAVSSSLLYRINSLLAQVFR